MQPRKVKGGWKVKVRYACDHSAEFFRYQKVEARLLAEFADLKLCPQCAFVHAVKEAKEGAT